MRKEWKSSIYTLDQFYLYPRSVAFVRCGREREREREREGGRGENEFSCKKGLRFKLQEIKPLPFF